MLVEAGAEGSAGNHAGRQHGHAAHVAALGDRGQVVHGGHQTRLGGGGVHGGGGAEHLDHGGGLGGHLDGDRLGLVHQDAEVLGELLEPRLGDLDGPGAGVQEAEAEGTVGTRHRLAGGLGGGQADRRTSDRGTLAIRHRAADGTGGGRLRVRNDAAPGDDGGGREAQPG